MNGIVLHADGYVRKTEDYESPRGTVENSFVDSKGGSVGASYVWSSGFFGVAFQRALAKYGVPGAEEDHHEEDHGHGGDDEHEHEEHAHKPVIDLRQDKITARGEWRVRDYGLEAIRAWFGVTDYAHDELIEEDGASEVGSRFTNKEYEGRIEAQHQRMVTSFGLLEGAAGIQFGRRDERGQSFEGESLLEPTETQRLAGFLFEELEFAPGARLQLAGRIEGTQVDGRGWSSFDNDDSHHYEPTAFKGSQSFLAFSGSAGLLHDFAGGITGRITGSYVERAPNAAELFSKGIHEATGTFEVGNPFLDNEKAATIELGLKNTTGSFRFDATAFASHYKGFIYRQLTGLACEGAEHNGHFHCAGDDHGHGHAHDDHEHGAFDLVFFRQRDANFYGLELAGELDVAEIWRGMFGLYGRYDFVNAKFSDGTNVPRIPPHRLGGGIYYREPNLFARLGVLHAFDQNRIGDEEEATPGYTNVSAEASYTVGLDEASAYKPSLTIGIKGNNLLDEEILNHASFKRREEVLLPGASVRVFGSLKWN